MPQSHTEARHLFSQQNIPEANTVQYHDRAFLTRHRISYSMQASSRSPVSKVLLSVCAKRGTSDRIQRTPNSLTCNTALSPSRFQHPKQSGVIKPQLLPLPRPPHFTSLHLTLLRCGKKKHNKQQHFLSETHKWMNIHIYLLHLTPRPQQVCSPHIASSTPPGPSSSPCRRAGSCS